MRFIYQAKNSPDKLVSGVIEADSRVLAETLLLNKGLFLVSVDEEPQTSSRRFVILERIRRQDVNIFTQQLSSLINAGIPLLKALEIIIEQVQNSKFRTLLVNVREKVKQGTSLSEALSDYAHTFGNLYVALVHAGESSGSLDKVLVSLSEFAEEEDDLRSKIQVALSYPALILAVGIITLYILFSFVIPKLSFLFYGISDTLPLATKLLLGASDFFRIKGILVLVVLSASIFIFIKRQSKTEQGQLKLSKFILGLPIIGSFIKKVQMLVFIKTSSLLLSHGISISRTLEVASKTVTNKFLFEKLNEARLDVINGASLKEALRQRQCLEPFAINLITSAEQSGSFDFAFTKIYDIYRRDIERVVKTFTSLLEPAMILIMGIIVGFVVMAILLPIFQANLILK